ncbi:MAG: alpha/beta hydrolase [Lapillicoccus sp.]
MPFPSKEGLLPVTGSGVAWDRSAVRSGTPVLFIHAGVADRTMWDPQWVALAATTNLVRLDLREFGESTTPPPGPRSRVDDVLETMDEAGLERVHLVGASMGAGVCVEVALTAPDRVASLLLGPPGGSLLATMTDDLREFVEAENAALDAGDLDAAVEANIRAWVLGPGRSEADVDADVVDKVRRMQRHVFEVGVAMGDPEMLEMDPPALDRLAEVGVPTLVLIGGHDLDTTKDAADRIGTGIRHALRVDWPDAAHLPSMEHPARFTDLLQRWLGDQQ